MTVNIDPNELKRHVISSTRGYWTIKHGPVEAKLPVLAQIAEYALANDMAWQALACWRILARLAPGAGGNHVARADQIERELDLAKPLARMLPQGFRLVRHSDAEYATWIESGAFAPNDVALRTTPFGAHAYMSQFGDGVGPMSFVLVRNDRTVAYVRCVVTLDRGVTDYGMPLQIRLATDLHANRVFQVVEMAMDVLKALALRAGACDIQLDDVESETAETPLGRAAYGRDYLPEIRVAPFVDLTKDEASIWNGVRSSYRPLIKAEQQSVSLRHFNVSNADETVIAAWRDLLATHNSPDKGRVQLETTYAKDGHAEISAGFLPDGSCCGVSVVRDDQGSSLYEIGNYSGDEGGRKYSHFFVYDAITRSKARNNTVIFLAHYDEPFARFACPGEILTHGKKYRDIEFFKRGFTDTVRRKLIYRAIL